MCSFSVGSHTRLESCALPRRESTCFCTSQSTGLGQSGCQRVLSAVLCDAPETKIQESQCLGSVAILVLFLIVLFLNGWFLWGTWSQKTKEGQRFGPCLSTLILEHIFPQHPQLETHTKKRILFDFQLYYQILVVEGVHFIVTFSGICVAYIDHGLYPLPPRKG